MLDIPATVETPTVSASERVPTSSVALPLYLLVRVLQVPNLLGRLTYEEVQACLPSCSTVWQHRHNVWEKWVQCWGDEARRHLFPSSYSSLAGSVARRAHHRQFAQVFDALDETGVAIETPGSLLDHRGSFLLEPFLWEGEEPLLVEADSVRLVRSGPWAPERRVRLAAAPPVADAEHAVNLAHFLGSHLVPHVLAPELPASDEYPDGAVVTDVSSTDTESQSGSRVLEHDTPDRFSTFWSSSGGTASSNDSLTIKMKPNFVAGVVIRFFRAQFQLGMPLFAPRSVRLAVRSPTGRLVNVYEVALPDASTECVWIPMALEWLSSLEFIFEGKHVAQRTDQQHYVAVQSIKVMGWRRDLPFPQVLVNTRNPDDQALVAQPETTITSAQLLRALFEDMEEFEEAPPSIPDLSTLSEHGVASSRNRFANDVAMSSLRALQDDSLGENNVMSTTMNLPGSLDYVYELRNLRGLHQWRLRAPSPCLDELLLMSEFGNHLICAQYAQQCSSISMLVQEQCMARISGGHWHELMGLITRFGDAGLLEERSLVPMLAIRISRIASYLPGAATRYTSGLAVLCAELSARRQRGDEATHGTDAESMDRGNAVWLAALVETVLPSLRVLPLRKRPWDTHPNEYCTAVLAATTFTDVAEVRNGGTEEEEGRSDDE